MKKIVIIFASIFLLTITGCSKKGTPLTLENYQDYLNVEVTLSSEVKGSGKDWQMDDVYTVTVKSKNSNYKFNDVVIVVDDIEATYDMLMTSIGKKFYNEDAFFNGLDIKIELPSSGNGMGINKSHHSTTSERDFSNCKVNKFIVKEITGTVSE